MMKIPGRYHLGSIRMVAAAGTIVTACLGNSEREAEAALRDSVAAEAALRTSVLAEDCSVGEDRVPNYSTRPEVSELMQCIRHGHTRKAILLIDDGVDLSYKTLIGAHALNWAVIARDTAVARVLIDRDVPLDPGPAGIPLLAEAISAGSLSLVVMLLDAGADPTGDALDEGPLISRAVRTDDTTMVGLMLSHGADVNVDPHDEFSGGPPLVEARSRPMVEFLLGRGADINLPEWYHSQSLLWRVVCSGRAPFDEAQDNRLIAELLIERGADVNHRDAGAMTGAPDDGRTPVFCAVQSSDSAMVALLLAGGARRDLIWNGKTLLKVAEEVGNEAITRMVQR